MINRGARTIRLSDNNQMMSSVVPGSPTTKVKGGPDSSAQCFNVQGSLTTKAKGDPSQSVSSTIVQKTSTTKSKFSLMVTSHPR